MFERGKRPVINGDVKDLKDVIEKINTDLCEIEKEINELEDHYSFLESLRVVIKKKIDFILEEEDK